MSFESRTPVRAPAAETRQSQPYHVIIACFLGWTLDAFDFFIMVFVIADVARSFGTSVVAITSAFTLTLGLRAVGALIFGRLAERYGRKPVLIANILMFSTLEFATGLAPTLLAFLAFRGLYGVAMGGEWGIGAALTMESIPARWRGVVSGVLQSGYSFGYLLAAALYGIGFNTLGWRGMFMVAGIPALLVLYVRQSVPESPAWQQRNTSNADSRYRSLAGSIRTHWKLTLYAIALMAAAATFSHGTQDLYPVMLRVQHHLSVHQVASLAVIFNIGAILGCLCGGSLSQWLGRRRQFILALSLGLILLPFWANASTVLMLGVTAFLMQFLVQCTFGVVPAHLNEISPPELRATFPGFTYQFGNLLAAGNATIQALLAARLGENFGWGLAIVVAIGAGCFLCLSLLGPEAKEANLAA